MINSISVFIILAFFLHSCSGIKRSLLSFDEDKNLTRSDIEDAFKGSEVKNKSVDQPPIPRLSKIISLPQKPYLDGGKVVSVDVTPAVQLSDVLSEVARLGGMNISIDKSVTGGIKLSVKDKKITEVLDAIARAGNLRYTIDNDIINITADTAYNVTYDLGFINIVRNSTSSMNVATSVLSARGGGGLNGGSSSSIQSTASDTLWDDVRSNVVNIIANHDRSTTEPNNNQQDSSNQQSTQNQQQQAQQQQLQQNQNQQQLQQIQQQFVNLNRQAGTLMAYTNSRGHDVIKEYIKKIKDKMTSQVLIEVKISEVTLNKRFERGVDWDYFARVVGGTPLTTIRTNSQFGSSSPSATVISNTTGNISTTISALETFGTTKILESPRITAVNNQQAIIQVAENKTFFDVKIQSTSPIVNNTQTVIPSQVSVTSTPNTIPVGVVLSMIPAINFENKTILLSVRPTLSKVSDTVEDPGLQYSAAKEKITGISNKVPITSVREIDTIASLKSGDILMIGGFTDRKIQKKEQGVWLLSRIPVLGWLFKNTVETTDLVETVILIKATIISNTSDENGISEYDKYFYKKFMDDPNEFTL